jgi:hypothetical protein
LTGILRTCAGMCGIRLWASPGGSRCRDEGGVSLEASNRDEEK